jgi:hypothetical protein
VVEEARGQRDEHWCQAVDPPGKVTVVETYRVGRLSMRGGDGVARRCSSRWQCYGGRWLTLGVSLQHHDDEGEVSGGLIEGKRGCERRSLEEWARASGGIENSGAGGSPAGGGGRAFEGRREEGSDLLRAVGWSEGGHGGDWLPLNSVEVGRKEREG